MKKNYEDHGAGASRFLQNKDKAKWHDETLWFVRSKRDKAAKQITNWEQLREDASGIKAHTLSRLAEYLKQFEQKAVSNGVIIHWATDSEEHNSIVYSILKSHNVKHVVKSKSMLTEECQLNQYLHEKGIEVSDTDLGEFIVQLRNESPSHIVLPAIHLKKQEVGKTFEDQLGSEKENSDPVYLTRFARQLLRQKFLKSGAAISGVNFAVAETGGIVICTNEGNADLGIHLTKLHIACMGIEKLIPKQEHLGVFLRLLARSATGQHITTYSSHFNVPAPGHEMHVVIVDNGRTKQLAREEFRNSLKCIRCGACFNTCPVYRRSGGHSYHNTVAGPIGSILAPNFDMKANADLPFASTLCGSCTNVCPVKINIHEQLWLWRQILMQEKYGPVSKRVAMKLMGLVLARPTLYNWSAKVVQFILNKLPFIINNRLNPWYKNREMPKAQVETFREWYKKNKKT